MRFMYTSSVIAEDIEQIAESDLWDNLSGKSLLITGATGMLGAYLSLAADAANKKYRYGIDLTLMCRDTQKARVLFKDVNCKLIFQDIRTPITAKGPSHYIVHAAGPTGPLLFANNPKEVLAVNTIGTISLLEYGIEHECQRFVFASTHEVYGQVQGEQMESTLSGVIDPMEPRTCYVLGKQAAENALACFGKQYGLATSSARFSRLYGPMMNLQSGLFISDFINNVLSGQPVHIRGGLNLLRPLCYIADATMAILHIISNGESGEAYNVQGDELPTIDNIANMLAKQEETGIFASQPETGAMAVSGHWLNTDKLKGIGWRQNINLQKGLERTIKYFRAQQTM